MDTAAISLNQLESHLWESANILRRRVISFVVILFGAGVGAQAQEAPILYYPLNEGQGKVAADNSGHKLDGVVSAA